MRFTKMQGLGNDYLYIYADSVPENAADLSIRLSDRHFGPGADGLIFIGPSDKADFRMRIFNADGSEAKMCGNGIRCVGKYVWDKGLTDRTELVIETGAGPRRLHLHPKGGTVASVTAEMGKALVEPRAEGAFFVNVGNPHLVLFVDDAETAPLLTDGPALSGSVPGGVNVEFVQVLGQNRLRMRVWERGNACLRHRSLRGRRRGGQPGLLRSRNACGGPAGRREPADHRRSRRSASHGGPRRNCL